jgi:putative phage-type endonuclease
MEQRSIEWYQARLGKFTASSFASLMAGLETAAFSDLVKDKAWERLTGTLVESYTNAAMQHGIDTEAQARDWYRFETGNEVSEIGFVLHPVFEVAGCSPDGLVQESGLVEIKCPQPRAHIDVLASKKLPSKYRWQVQGQLWITGRKWCDFVSYHPAQGGICIRVEADADDQERLIERVQLADRKVIELLEKAA